MLISPTEPFPIKQLGIVSPMPERYGADMLMLSRKVRTGVQRKKFPEDLIASLADGRLYEQVHQMSELERRIVILEGYGKWTTDGTLVDLYGMAFTKEHLYGIVFTLAFEFGIEVYQVRDINETMRMLTALEKWTEKAKHNSLRTRPGPRTDSWGTRGNREYSIHLLQSFKGIGPDTAAKIYDTFGRAPLQWTVTEEELRTVPGIGKPTAKRLWEGLNGS